jgi:DNA-binding HxlR family transcriptional regulator
MAVTAREGTSGAADAGPPGPRPPLSGCRAREVLHRVGDKWSVYVIDRLGQGSHRFSELRRGIEGITGRMLTVTLRGLERDGLVTRTIYPVIPPRVDYELTPMGTTLLQTIEQLIDWADSHTDDIYAARAEYDARHAAAADGACEAEPSTCEAEAGAPCDPAEPGNSGLAGAGAPVAFAAMTTTDTHPSAPGHVTKINKAGLCAVSAVATAETAHDRGSPRRLRLLTSPGPAPR